MPDLSTILVWLKSHITQLALTIALIVSACLILPLFQAPDQVTRQLTARTLLRGQREAITQAYEVLKLEEMEKLTISCRGDVCSKELVHESLASLEVLPPLQLVTTHEASTHPHLHISFSHKNDHTHLEARLTAPHRHNKANTPIQASARHGSWSALLPPFIAVVLALIWRHLLLALGSAVWLGAALQVSGNPWLATKKMAVDYLWPNITDPFNLYVTGFTVSLVGMVHIILKMGGMAGLLDRLKVYANTARSTRLTTALMGGAIFFDDYANTIVVGSTMRPMSDSHRISREKFAYLVDSTSAPIAGLAIISTWIGYEVGLFDDLSRTLGLGQSGYAIFFDILTLRFYCIFTLCFVLMNAWSGRDFGPMLEAEVRAVTTGKLLPEHATLLKYTSPEHIDPKPDIPYRGSNAIIPVVTVILCVIVGMVWSGWQNDAKQGLPGLFGIFKEGTLELLGQALVDLRHGATWRDAFSAADNARVLFWSAILGSLMAATLALTRRLLTPKEVIIAWLRAIPSMGLAVAILLLAWSIRAVCDDLNTSVFLVGAVQDVLDLVWLPLVTFLLAGAIAFATGTSWGTMGILLPAMIPLAYSLSLSQGEPRETILMLCFAAVLDGAIFGDHCSPISDTTVMSSLATECDHVEHVRTQAPYALTTMCCAAGPGYMGVALGLPVWLALLLGIVTCALALTLLGRSHTA